MEEQMKKLAIFFPGIGYHCDKPLLYYARKLTQECGYEESILLSYSYDGRNTVSYTHLRAHETR